VSNVLAAAVAIERPVGYLVGMTRRRLIVGAFAAVVLAAVVTMPGIYWPLYG